MREILFRGKKVEGGEWFHGNLLKLNKKAYLVPQNTWFDYGRLKAIVEVTPETVGQYTGLTDKNGKKIFEGDIVKAECDLYHGENKKERVTHVGAVIYDKKFCQFGINVAGFSKCYILNRWKGDYNEVIGNIHDNPELLKGGAE